MSLRTDEKVAIGASVLALGAWAAIHFYLKSKNDATKAILSKIGGRGAPSSSDGSASNVPAQIVNTYETPFTDPVVGVFGEDWTTLQGLEFS